MSYCSHAVHATLPVELLPFCAHAAMPCDKVAPPGVVAGRFVFSDDNYVSG